MSETRSSVLQVRKVKTGPQVVLVVETKAGSTLMPVGKWLSPELASLPIDQLHGKKVDYEWDRGQISCIRPKGIAWSSPVPQRHYHQPNQPARRHDFYNPYNFIPALPREEVNNDLGDKPPVGHHAYHPDHWSGRIRVRLETVTPLLLPDAARMTCDNNDHKTYPVRRDAGEVPYLPPTSIKGMLRAAYEAVTNSRLGVFHRHTDRLAYRMEAQQGLSLVPALIEEADDNHLRVRLMPGLTSIGWDGRPVNNIMYAAWLPRYKKYCKEDSDAQPDKHESSHALKYAHTTKKPQHGEKVWVRVQKKIHRSKKFSFFKVVEIRERQEGAPCPVDFHPGRACITGPNIMVKHDERVFLESSNGPMISVNAEEFRKKWEELISNYQQLHKEKIDQREKEGQAANEYLGHEPECTGWSRHVYEKDAIKLIPDTLCYARVEKISNGKFKINDLYPVMISRGLYKVSPAELLAENLQPASRMDKLSPADRVFGWVRQAEGATGILESLNHAFKGQLRVGPVMCLQRKEAVAEFKGIPLAILGQPKPQQARFYAARNSEGEPLPDRTKKDQGYLRGHGLRGRKVYPHHYHLAMADYWQNVIDNKVTEPLVINGRHYHYECRRQGDEKDNQNRTVEGWIKPGITFSFDLHINNLSKVELGGLLWLLSLEEDHYFRLGGGKPLGFGSVRLSIDSLQLRDGQGWEQFYSSFLTMPELSEHSINSSTDELFTECKEAYKQAVTKAYATEAFEQVTEAYTTEAFERVTFIKAFRAAARGFPDGKPVCYPRLDEKPNPKGEGFKWFVENERDEEKRLSLPALYEEEPGLPWK